MTIDEDLKSVWVFHSKTEWKFKMVRLFPNNNLRNKTSVVRDPMDITVNFAINTEMNCVIEGIFSTEPRMELLSLEHGIPFLNPCCT